MDTADQVDKENHVEILNKIIETEREEHFSEAALTSETLSRLNLPVDALPYKCRQMLEQAARLQAELDMVEIDPIAITLRRSQLHAKQMEVDYATLKYKQKSEELEAKIESNNKVLGELRADKKYSMDALAQQDPNPDNIGDRIRQMTQKVASYEEKLEKAKSNYAKLSVPDDINPKAIVALSAKLAELKAREEALHQDAEHILFLRKAKQTIKTLRR